MIVTLRAPELLASGHIIDDFTCGVDSVDFWLTRHASRNMTIGASRVFVVADDDKRIVGYYCLSNGSILREKLPHSRRHGTPALAPVLLIGQFGVDTRYQGRGIGYSMLRDALMRCARVSLDTGFMFILVHPDGEDAFWFWTKFSFRPHPRDDLSASC